MKDLEIIIYLIVALLWLLSRNYRKVQQNRPGQSPRTRPLPATPTGTPAPQTAKTTTHQPVQRKSLIAEYKSEPAAKHPHQADFTSIETEPTAAFFKNLLSEETPAVAATEKPATLPLIAPAELRKAIIYSEILKRRYF